MSFADPQSVDVGAGAVSLPRTSVGSNSSVYTSADGNLAYTISSLYGKRIRRTARITLKKNAADPLFPANFLPYSMSCYIVLDVPLFGFTPTEAKLAGVGLLTNLTAGTNANLIKLTQGEN